MSGLPENGVKVFEFDQLFAAFDLDAVRSALEDALVSIDTAPGSLTPIPAEIRRRLREVKQARETLLAFLGHPGVTEDVGRLREAYTSIRTGGFGPAHDALKRVKSHPEVPTITVETVELGYSGDISYSAFIKGPPDAEGEFTAVRVTRILGRGYAGDAVPAADLIALNTFARAGAERKRLLVGECLYGLGGSDQLVQAIEAYAAVLPAAVTDHLETLGVEVDLFVRYRQRQTGPRRMVVMPGIYATWNGPPGSITPEQQFAALRSAFAHLALGDHLQRRHRVVTGTDRDRLSDIYAAATRLVVESGITTANALRGQIEAHAAGQRRKLAAGLNALGLWDGFVPVLRHSALARLAEDAINDFSVAAGNALGSLRSAEDLIGQELDLSLELDEEDLRTATFVSRIQLAELQEQQANEQIELVEDQQKFLVLQTAAGLFSHVMNAVADPKRALASVGGIVETGVNHFARSAELGHQLEMARLGADAAEVQSDIADLELHLAERRKEHLAQRIEFLVHRQVDADLYLTLAELHERRASRLLDSAILLAYLAERALAFARGRELQKRIRFDYWADPDPDTISEPERLSAVARLNEAAVALRADFEDLTRSDLLMLGDKLQTFQEHVSLAEQYPLEFAKLLQDGEALFEYSLYQLSKRFPFTHKCRLYGVAVEVNAVGATGGPRGVLEHTGGFLVRDRATVAQATRLVPTDAELAAAIRTQRAEGRGVAAVQGVLAYALKPDPMVFTLNSPLIPVNAPDDLLPDELLRALEGYAPTGLWRLQLHNLDELRITDVTLHLGLVAGVDTGEFEDRVSTLVAEYEAEWRTSQDGEPLDKVTGFALRQQFPDLFADLGAGAVTMDLDRESFPSGMANLQFKALVVQALDANDRGLAGIAVRVARDDGGFQLDRDTRAGGFSENLDIDLPILPRDDRFPVVGAWRIELADPSQFDRLGDLRLFFLYSYE